MTIACRPSCSGRCCPFRTRWQDFQARRTLQYRLRGAEPSSFRPPTRSWFLLGYAARRVFPGIYHLAWPRFNPLLPGPCLPRLREEQPCSSHLGRSGETHHLPPHLRAEVVSVRKLSVSVAGCQSRERPGVMVPGFGRIAADLPWQ